MLPSAILVLKIQIFNADSVTRANMRHRAKFCGDRSNCCRVIAFLLLLRYMALCPWPLTFWSWTMVIHGRSRVQVIHWVKDLRLFVFSERQLRYVRYMLSQFRVSVVCLSSVTLVRPTQPVKIFRNFFSPYDSTGILVFWCQNSLVGDAPFPLKFAFKVTHTLLNSEISTNIGS